VIYDELKSKYEQISGTWPEEAKSFSELLLSVIDRLERRIKTLEDQVAQNSRNSSKPPSQDMHRRVKEGDRWPSGRKAGGQKGHTGQGGKLKDDPDKILPYTLGDCPKCGQDLRPVGLDEIIRKQVEDLPPIKTTVTEHRIEVKTCPGCGVRWQAGGCDVQHEFEYGPNVKSLSVYLSAYQFVPQKRVKALLGVFGLELSTGTLNNFRKAAARQIGPFVEALRLELTKAPAAFFDETGIRVGGVNHWAHVAATKTLAFFGIHRHRGQKAHQDMDILPKFKGTAHHDSYRSYDDYPQSRHSLCGAHIIRELCFAIERDGQQPWAEPMIDLLLQIKKQREARTEGVCDHRWQSRHRNTYRQLIQQGLQMNPPAHRPDGQTRGAVKQSKTYNLLIRMRDREEDILRFMIDPIAEFTNNQAERDLRMNKVRAKVSGGFRALAPAEEFMCIRSLITTAVKQAVCPLKTLNQVFTQGNTEFMGLVIPD
jgi:transposase